MGTYKGGKRQPQHRKDGCLSALPMALLLTVKAMLAERRSGR